MPSYAQNLQGDLRGISDRQANGDFDTIGILYILDSAGERKEVNRYFAEEERWREIDLSEYEQRRQMDADRRLLRRRNKHGCGEISEGKRGCAFLPETIPATDVLFMRSVVY